MNLSVREATVSDIAHICNYWFTASRSHLMAMGVEPSKMIERSALNSMLKTQLALPIRERNSMCYIWEMDGKPIGHCNSNPTRFGQEAKMHLHIWDDNYRRLGIGLQLLEMTIPKFFQQLNLKLLICEPYAQNEAPNRTLAKAGFVFEREHVTTPGGHSFEQPVNTWILTKQKFQEIFSDPSS